MSQDLPVFLPDTKQATPCKEDKHDFIDNDEVKLPWIEQEISHGTVIEIEYRRDLLREFELLFLVQMGRLPEQHEIEAFARGKWNDEERNHRSDSLRSGER